MLNSDIKISVIVPAYNIAEYLPRCLDSILAQTHKNLEIIVISDGSADGTNDVMNEYAEKDKRIIPIFKENSGVSDTRNKGLDAATGDYIGFVDGDDYIEPEMYELLLDNALKYNADISHCGYQMVFPSRVDYYYNTGKKVIQDNEKGVLDLIKGDYIEPGIWNKLYKKSVLKNVRMPVNIRENEDVIFNVRAFLNAERSFYEDKPFYHYVLRKNSSTLSGNYKKKLYDVIAVSKMIIDECANCSELIKNTAYERYITTVIGAYRSVHLAKKKSLFAYVNELRKGLKKANTISKKVRCEVCVFKYFPHIYMLIYRVYFAFLSNSKNKYEVK